MRLVSVEKQRRAVEGYGGCLLAAQCKLEKLSLLTVDAAFGEFGIDIVWSPRTPS